MPDPNSPESNPQGLDLSSPSVQFDTSSGQWVDMSKPVQGGGYIPPAPMGPGSGGTIISAEPSEESIVIDGIRYRISDPVAQAYIAKQSEQPKSVEYVEIGGINYRTTDPIAQAYLSSPNAPSAVIKSKPIETTPMVTTEEKQVYIEAEKANYPLIRDYIEQSKGNLAYYNSLDKFGKEEYLQQLQSTQQMDVKEYISKSGGSIDYYEGLEEEQQEEYLGQLEATGEMDIQDFIEKSGGSYDYYTSLPKEDKPQYLQQLQSTQEMEYQKYEEAKNILAPYISTSAWQQITQEGEYINPSYDLGAITQKDLKERPEIKTAITTLFPDYDTSQLGIKYVDINQYKILGQVVPVNGQIPEAGVPLYDAETDEYVVPRIGLTINDYYDKMRGGQPPEEVKRLYYPIVTLTEYKEYNPAKLAELGVIVRPTIQEITREMAGIDPTKELTATDAAKLFGAGFSIPFQVVVPFVATGVGLATKQLSGGWLGVSIASDALSAIPLVRAVSLGARAVSTAGRLARATAIAEAVGQELIANLKAPFTMLRHPIATIQAGGRTVVDEFENIFSKAKINEAVFNTANSTVKIRIGKDMTYEQALVARDAIMKAGIESGQDIHIQLLNDVGDVVSEANVPRSAFMKEVGGGVVHTTPMGETFLSELEDVGYVLVRQSEGLDDMGMFVSLDPAPRFTITSAYGKTGEQPVFIIFDKDSEAAKAMLTGGSKTYRSQVELEGRIPEAVRLLYKDMGYQILYTRIGPDRTKALIILTKPLSNKSLLKLKMLGIIEGVKAPFKQPITFKGGAIDSLTDAEIRVLKEELELSGNARVAEGLVRATRGDEGLISSLRASGMIRSGNIEDARIYAEDIRIRSSIDTERMAINREDSKWKEATAREMEAIAREDRIARGEERLARSEDIDRIERIEKGERVTRLEEPERIERIDEIERIERIEEPDRISRIEEPERITRIPDTDRLVRTAEPTRLGSIPRISEPPRVTEPPRISEPPRIKEPPKIIRPPLRADGKPLTREQLEGAIGWKQGIMYKYIYPPYGQEDILNSRSPIQGIPIKEGIRSAYETIIRTRKGFIPAKIQRHMGMMDLVITDADKNGQPEIHFIEREVRKGRGAVAKKITPQVFKT